MTLKKRNSSDETRKDRTITTWRELAEAISEATHCGADSPHPIGTIRTTQLGNGLVRIEMTLDLIHGNV